MPAFFQEIFAVAGVDEGAKPRPGMIVPLGGSNIVCLRGGAGLRLDAPRTLKIQELPQIPSAILTALWLPINLIASPKPGALGDGRYFRISASASIGHTPAQVRALRSGKAETALDVAVLKRKKIKLSIRPVQVRGPQGGLVYHSKKPMDFNLMVEQMNAIWTPQANILFELVSSSPAPIVDEAEIAKILDLKMSKTAPLPSMVVLQRFRDVLLRFKDKSADLTMFLVESAGDLADPRSLYSHAKVVHGVTDPQLGISLISDSRSTHHELLAHEAGHFIGSFVGQGGVFVVFGHRGGKRDLMQDGASDIARIPFHDVIDYFNKP
jgi:hypothetical protein